MISSQSQVIVRPAVDDVIMQSEPTLAKALPEPYRPTPAEAEAHYAGAHLPPRAWCRFCVENKGVSLPHAKQSGKEHGIPVISCDYFYMGDDEDTGLPLLAVKDGSTGRLFAHALPTKGRSEYGEMSLSGDYLLLGYKEMVVKSDNEPALLQLKKAAVARTAGVNCQPEESPVGEPESN